jgi:hypothetical protein
MGQWLLPLRGAFEWVDTFPSSIAIRESQYVYPGLLTSHVVALMLFAGLILMMDLRLLGIGNMQTPFSQLQRRLFPIRWPAWCSAPSPGWRCCTRSRCGSIPTSSSG